MTTVIVKRSLLPNLWTIEVHREGGVIWMPEGDGGVSRGRATATGFREARRYRGACRLIEEDGQVRRVLWERGVQLALFG